MRISFFEPLEVTSNRKLLTAKKRNLQWIESLLHDALAVRKEGQWGNSGNRPSLLHPSSQSLIMFLT
jgi:hypothetical protein